MRNTFNFFRWPRAAAFLTALWLLPSIWAHAILLDSTPALHAALQTGKSAVRFRFNSRVDGGRSRLILVLPDRTTRPVTLLPQPSADVLAAALEGLKPGAYVIRWQVLAADGHISRGEVPFTVAAPASGQ